MPDAWHVFGEDLLVSASGDLLIASGSDETTQRIIRRLYTNPTTYIWELNYGAGLPAQIGQPVSANTIAAIIQSQMLLEDGVAQDPPPTVAVQADTTGRIYATITYTDAVTSLPVPLTLPIG